MTQTRPVAIIPARGGSKRIPGKNIKLFCGDPIIAYSVRATLKTGLFGRIIVSTDSPEIAAAARSFGAETPFMRPPELADDFTGTAGVLAHALGWLAENGSLTEYFCCIYATAPFVRAEDLIRGFSLLRERNAPIAFSVATYPYPIFRSLKIAESGTLEMIWPEYENTRSNDLPEAYHDAGQFYWGNRERFMKDRSLFAPGAVPVVIPRHLVQDIDTPEDWETAEKMYRLLTFGKTV